MGDFSFVVNDRSIPGYLAEPTEPVAGGWPGVVVIHEAFGLNDDIRAKADDFAAHGYLALAPDLFEGKFWMGCIRKAFSQLKNGSGPSFEVLDRARASLAERSDCSGQVGVIGFCMGGGFALLCAPRPGFGAASINYGQVPQDAEAALAGACPIVGSFGGRDPMGTKPVERLERALVVLDVPHDIEVYPASGHHFMSKSSGAGAVLAKVLRLTYNEVDAADSWRRIYAFFGTELRRPSTTG